MKRLFYLVCTVLMCALAVTAQAIESVTLQGMFGSKAVLMVDGKHHVVAQGNSSPEGVKVISVGRDSAVLEVNGKRKQYGLNTTVSVNFKPPETREEKIYRDAGGMYRTVGSINGYPVTFLIDTGASSIAMNTLQAKRLGIHYRENGKLSGVSTASGYEKAYRVRLKKVSVGGITQRNVEAMVIDGEHPGPILLGMTFLGRLQVEHKGDAMTLRQRK